MQKRLQIKNFQVEIQIIAKRSLIAFIFILILIGLLISRLLFLQVQKNDMYTTLATKNWLDLVPVEPTRGLIFDRNGVLLAENISVFSLDVIPYQVSDMAKTIANVRKYVDLSDDDINQFKRQLRQHRRFDEIPLRLRLSDDEVARFAENQHRFQGVFIKARLMRHYPYGENFAHVLGYVGRINTNELDEIDQTNYSASQYIGKLGIEKYYEEELHGKVGYEEVENDASGKPLRVLKELKGIPGKNLFLTLDSGLQFASEKALQGKRGAVVAIQPATGQVLAMVSEPAYDPNLFVLGISQKDYQALQNSPERPLYDRALRGQYPIASTIKPYLALDGLTTETVSPSFTIYDHGIFMLPNSSHIFHDWRKQGHGVVNVSRAVTSSCDVFFFELGSKLGIRQIKSFLTQFGFGTLSGIDLDGELPGNVPSPEWKIKARGEKWYPGDTVISSIGQGDMQATPLQLASAVSTMANRGRRLMPYLLLGEQLPGKAYTAQQPTPLKPVILSDKKYWDIVIRAMQEVAISPAGTAYHAFGKDYPYTLAAKTGTGAVVRRHNPNEEDKQENMPEKLRDHHLFVVFAPIDKPVIALGIVSENANTAMETARIILDYYLGKLQNVNRRIETKTEKTET